MKLNKKILKKVISEALNELEKADSSTEPQKFSDLRTGVMSTSQRLAKSKDRIKSAGEQLQPNEQKIIEQIEQKLTELASLPEVDLVKHRPLLSRVLKILNQQIAPKK